MPGSRKATLGWGAVLYLAVCALLATVVIVVGVIQGSITSHGAPPSIARAREPGIPCATPSTTGAVKSTGQAANKAGTHGGAWTGIVERVFAKTNAAGSVVGTPKQQATVSASGNSPVTVQLPVSGPVSGLSSHRQHQSQSTSVTYGLAQIRLHPHGTTSKLLVTDFDRPMPVSVAVTYRLNGKPISSSQIAGKSGTVQVSYKLTNVSSRPISACFEGFNGQQQRQTLSTPVPIIGTVSFTVPKQATSFTAPGSSLSPSYPGVFVLWAASLFEPLGPLTQTFTFTMKTTDATIPKAAVVLDAVNPKTITGKAPARTATALGRAEAAVAKGVAAIRITLGAVQRRVSKLQKLTSSNDPPRAADPSPDAVVRTEFAALGKFLAAVLAKVGTLRTSLGTTASDSTRLSRATAGAATLVTAIRTDVAAIATAINGFTTRVLPPAVQNALSEVKQFKTIVADLQAFGPGARSDPEWPKLVADVAVGQALAGKIKGAITKVQRFAQAVASDAQALRDGMASLKARAAALKASAAALAATVKQVIRDRLGAVLARVAAFQARFAQIASRIKARFARVEALVRRVRARLAAAVAAAKQALAKALSQGEQATRAAIIQARAKAAQTEAKIQSDLTQANFQYARLLCLDEQAVANEVPGGSAPNVSEQTGWYLLQIPAISGKSKQPSAKKSHQPTGVS